MSESTASAAPSRSRTFSRSGALSSMKSRWMTCAPATGSISEISIATTWPWFAPLAFERLHLLDENLRPAARGRAQIDDHLPRFQKRMALVHLDQFVGGPRAIAGLLSRGDVRVVELALEPLARRQPPVAGFDPYFQLAPTRWVFQRRPDGARPDVSDVSSWNSPMACVSASAYSLEHVAPRAGCDKSESGPRCGPIQICR